MSKQEFIKTQSSVLRVNIQCDCDGCRNKVKKLLLKVDGVYTVSIDSKQGKVTVTGNADPAVLIRKLEKSGKRAELWIQKNNQFNLGNKFKNAQMDSAAKGGHKETNKSQKSVAKNNHQATNAHIQQILQQMRGASEQKSVKFNMPTNHNGQTCDDDFDGEDDDEEDEDGYDDDSDEEDEDDHSLNDLFGHSQHANTKTIQRMGNNGHKNKGNGNKGQQAGKHKKFRRRGGGGNGKKGGGFHLPAIIKSIALSTGCKKINVAKRGGGHGAGNAKKGNHSHGGTGTKGGGEAKNGNRGGSVGGGNNKIGGANSGKNGQKNGNGKKKNGGGAKGEGIHDMNVLPQNVKGNGNMGLAGQVGPMGQVGNYPMGPFQQGPQATGAMNGKYYNQGMGSSPLGNNNHPYANQQYMAMLMNQQRMMMNAEAMQQQQAMYGRPTIPPGIGYVPPPPAYDPLTHMFSDENTGSCSIM